MEAQDNVHNVIPLNFLQHLTTAHIYPSYKHLAYVLYKHKVKHQIQSVIQSKRGVPPKTTKWKQMIKTKIPNNSTQCKQNIENTPAMVQINSQNTSQNRSLPRLHKDISCKSLDIFAKPANILQDKVQML